MDATSPFLKPDPAVRETAKERRLHRRKPVVWLGMLDTAAVRSITCAILNVSLGGAKISAEAVVAVGDPVKLTIMRYGTLAATVVWYEDGEIGVRFLDAPARVAAMLSDARVL